MSDEVTSLVQDLGSRTRATRRAAESALLNIGAPAVTRLLALLVGPRSSVGADAQDVLVRMGQTAVPTLQDIRRSGPGHLRRPALQVLADIGGAQALSDRDRAAAERLVRIKLLDEVPERLPVSSWIAFPADRLDTLAEGFGLYDLQPATVAMGLSATSSKENAIEGVGGEASDGGGDDDTAYRVFISPDFQGWRLMYGDAFMREYTGIDAVEEFSRHCGEAQFFSVDSMDNSNVWRVARYGEVVRAYSTYGDPEWIGEPLPFERTFIDAGEDSHVAPADIAQFSEGVTDAHDAAFQLSFDPRSARKDTMRLHGWLATTRADVPNARFRGALRI
ncbi:HEAT repeat domain-containing protein [Streptomyces sp. NPDC017529]|uniref:HEAT repeat domain-containing protein n=1 Tax=Streptomyces sp. NPDC017529 TaxID=3365000 RepID=UPI00378E8092